MSDGTAAADDGDEDVVDEAGNAANGPALVAVTCAVPGAAATAARCSSGAMVPPAVPEDATAPASDGGAASSGDTAATANTAADVASGDVSGAWAAGGA